jgi:hypothetical protein
MSVNGDNQTTLAEALGMQQSALSARMNGKTDFRKNEMEVIRKRYNLDAEKMQEIFFAN